MLIYVVCVEVGAGSDGGGRRYYIVYGATGGCWYIRIVCMCGGG